MIELMIALCAVALCSVAIAHVQSLIIETQQDTAQYLEAVNHAHAVLAFGNDITMGPRGKYNVTVVENRDDVVPYIQRSVTVSWKTSRGTQKQIKICDGRVNTKG